MSTPIPKNACELDAASAARATGGKIVRESGRRARGIVSDTRAIAGGEAFVALRGERHDGHAFLGEAARRGAAMLIVDRIDGDLPREADVVRVDDTLGAWGDLARARLAAWRAEKKVVAITGSAGKTTTKQLCAALLATRGTTWATPGNLNNLVGVPAVLFALTAEHRFAVIECGMSVRGEIERLGAIVEPDVAVITNVGLAHAEGVGGTRQDVAREKGALFRHAKAACVYDAEDALSTELAAQSPRKLGFGRAKHADYKLLDRVSRGREGSRVTIERPCAECASPTAREIVELELPFVGEAAAIDLCAALAAAELAAGSISQDALDAAMRSVRNVEGRAGVLDLGEVLVVDDTYNANPASMRAALAILAELAGARRRVAVLGEMKELGPAAPAEHAAIGDALAAAGVALAIGCGGLADQTMSRARELGIEALACRDLEAAVAASLERVHAGDVVLVKGSRSVGAERIVEALERRFKK
ncbi:MAG TPA: UDP-N-acetylmuramoyl-tripeptide--D-alanyl-D-alanine ligase [Polyangiaceae bacterium]|jgi:UDP-N-acetylmuramoyl-tripeptide--D-alanyl-D-alanine ligase